jgi:hypothetical protein
MKRQDLQGIKRGKVVRPTIARAVAPCPLDRVKTTNPRKIVGYKTVTFIKQ